MGTTPLRQFLWSLCHNSCWNYAVFWKLQQQNEMFLTWEDGCYDHQKLRASMESILDDICFDGSNEIVSSSWGSSRHDGHSGEYPIGQVMADMESVQYAWGEGVVGEVAYTGKHCWVLFDNVAAGEFTCKVVHECPDERLPQFAAGIKTILLVPVVPCGVLQLGSLEKVAEYPALVAYVRIFNFISCMALVKTSGCQNNKTTYYGKNGADITHLDWLGGGQCLLHLSFFVQPHSLGILCARD